jgi:uncharacterized protein
MNTIGYFEIHCTDPKREITFYQLVFGWKFIREHHLPVEYYRVETGSIGGGLLKRPSSVPPEGSGTNAFVCSVEVRNFDETSELIIKNGGAIALPKFAVPGRCWQGYFLDPDHNTFGIFEVDEKAA